MFLGQVLHLVDTNNLPTTEHEPTLRYVN